MISFDQTGRGSSLIISQYNESSSLLWSLEKWKQQLHCQILTSMSTAEFLAWDRAPALVLVQQPIHICFNLWIMHIFPLKRKRMDSRINLDRLCSNNDFYVNQDVYLQNSQYNTVTDCNLNNKLVDPWHDLWFHMHAGMILHN